ncbi:MAG: SoxY-related AACIE arm protein [Pseudomonadota bacterium]
MKPRTHALTRRTLLAQGGGVVGWLWVGNAAAQQAPSAATDALPDALAAAVSTFTNGAPVKAGRVKLDIANLVDNGNSVPTTVTVESPMTAADHVTAIAVFNERNPQREVFKAQLGPLAGKAEVSTRIRLATTQKLIAVARMSDGSYWQHTVDVIVTLAACIEEPA